jgi:hypothetical protein
MLRPTTESCSATAGARGLPSGQCMAALYFGSLTCLRTAAKTCPIAIWLA